MPVCRDRKSAAHDAHTNAHCLHRPEEVSQKSEAEAVHGAVKVHGGDAVLAVRLEDAVDDF